MLGVTAVMMFALTGCGKITVNLDKYVTITAEGYDSMGTASYDFDYDAFKKDYSGKIKNSKKSNELSGLGLLSGETLEELLLDFCVSQKLDKTSGLSNGDVITLMWNCEDAMAEEYFNVKLDYSDITYTVKGLSEVGSFNPFDYVTVEFSGIAPNGTVNLNPNYNQSEIQYITFSSDLKTGLNNGDVITVTANINGSVDSFIEKYGTILNPTEQTFTVNGLQSYVMSSSAVTSEALESMKRQAEDVYLAHAAKHWGSGEVLQSFTYLGNYYLTRKDGMSGDSNYIYLVYKCDITDDGKPASYYYYTRFKNLVLNGDGTCSVDTTSYETPSDTHRTGIGGYYYGYGSIDDLYKKCVQSRVDSYAYENNVNN